MLVLQEQRAHAVHDAGHAAARPPRRGDPISSPRPPASTPTRRASVSMNAGERADRVRAAADARDDDVGIVAVEDRARTARALRRRRRAGTRAPSTGTDADPSPSRGSSASPRPTATHSRIASLTASFSVALPDSHRHDLGAEQLHAPHVERLALDVDRAHVDGAVEPEQRGARSRSRRRAGPAPVSAITRFLPMRRVSRPARARC